MLISLYASRVILHGLGNTDFGVYNLVGGIVVLFSFLNTSMTASTQRFINFSLGRKEEGKVTQVFTFAFISHVVISIVIVLLAETIGLWFVTNKLNIPADRHNAAFWVYQISILSTIFSVLRCPFNASIIAYEKMSFFAWISIIEAGLRLGIALMILVLPDHRLIFYAIALCASALIITGVYWQYTYRKLPSIRFKYTKDNSLFKEMLSFSGWSVFGNAANVAMTQGVSIILNIFYGVIVNAAMGIANQINGLAGAFVSNFQTAFMPQISQSYASGDTSYFNNLIFRSSKYSFFLAFVISYPVFFNCDFILDIWLGSYPEYTSALTRVVIICSVIEALNGPLWMAAHARGDIRNYQIIVSLVYFMTAIFCYMLAKIGEPAPIAFSAKIAILGIMFTYRLWYIKKYFTFDLVQFIKNVILRIILVSILGVLIAYILIKAIDGDFIRLILMSITGIVLLYWGLLDAFEREYIKNIAVQKFSHNDQ